MNSELLLKCYSKSYEIVTKSDFASYHLSTSLYIVSKMFYTYVYMS